MASADAKLLVLADKYRQLEQKILSELEVIKQSHVEISKAPGPQGPKGDTGPKGESGKDGINGKDGKDGANGADGVDGKDGISVVDASIDLDNSLVLRLSDGSVIDAGQIDVKGTGPQVVNSSFPIRETPAYAVRYDEIDSSTAYRGEATAGADNSSPLWRIQKIVIVNNDITITWAGGDVNFDKVWNDRLTYTYS